MKKTQTAVAAALLGLMMGGAPLPALAQEAKPQGPDKEDAKPDAVLKRVEVSGSRIRRLDAETTSPIEVMTRKDIEASGATSIGDLLRNLTSNGASNINENSLGTYTPGAQALNMRNLGEQSTLLLVNGRRLAAYPRAAGAAFFGDLNSIPVSVIDRVDIIKDGASAIYGSDAIAGVVNIILRKEFSGLELNASAGRSKYGDAGRRTLALTAGMGDVARDRYNLWGNLELIQRDPYFQGKRSDSYVGNRDTRPWGWQDDRSRYSPAGNLQITLDKPFLDPATGRTASRFIVPLDKACAPEMLGAHPAASYGGLVCWHDEFKTTQTQAGADSQRLAFNSGATLALNAETEAFARLSLLRNTTNSIGIGQPFGPYLHPDPILLPSHPQYPTQAMLPPGASLANIVRADITYMFQDTGGTGSHTVSQSANAIAGLKGRFQGWDWEAALNHQVQTADATRRGELLKAPVFEAIATGKYRFGGPNSPELLASLLAGTTDKFKTTLTVADFRASKPDLFRLPTGDVGLAVGAETRNESYFSALSPLASSGAILGITGQSGGWDVGRRVSAVYGELSVPLHKTLEAQVALRHDHYSDVGGVSKPKLALLWRPTKELLLRSSYAEGFRAPNVLEVAPITSGGYVNVNDPKRCDGNDCGTGVEIRTGGNPALKPEQSKGYFLGFMAEPIKDLSFGLDYWRFQRFNEIGDPDPQTLVDHPERYPDAVVRGPRQPGDPASFSAGPITLIQAIKRNATSTMTDGLDFEIHKVWRTAEWGRFSADFSGSYLAHIEFQYDPEQAPYSYAGFDATPRLRHTLGLRWEQGPLSLGLSRNTVGGFFSTSREDNCSIATNKTPPRPASLCEIRPHSVINLNAGYKGLLKGLDLQLNVDNLLNAVPPFNVADSGSHIFGGLHSAMGRYLQVSAKYRY
ncbi:iron complex outermembrane receptor protein [Paucibacter oligotrophus]|uniref:Iron complex outermembrane receptor protein n=1 Tax=Roseateles oligotrophus TaxID=1769250 RepID=A0A840LBQ4_9BURK|nr:TonB-dependent receptor [Roseateles oligotrophus]MBB4845590.1 iron complex outermembrane receptor protein [Roseateles oligotrophus]